MSTLIKSAVTTQEVEAWLSSEMTPGTPAGLKGLRILPMR